MAGATEVPRRWGWGGPVTAAATRWASAAAATPAIGGRSSRACRGILRHKPRKESWRLYDCASVLGWDDILQEVVDVARSEAKKVTPDVAAHEELEEHQSKWKLVAFDAETEE